LKLAGSGSFLAESKSSVCPLDDRHNDGNVQVIDTEVRKTARIYLAVLAYPQIVLNGQAVNGLPIRLSGNAFCPSYTPSQCTRHRFARHGIKCLFVKGHPTRGINPDKNLRGSGSGQPGLNFYGGSVVQRFIMTTMGKPGVSPPPKNITTYSHATHP